MVTAELLARARAGDGEAFRELAGPHRRELQVHCYRMLGSFADAEDALVAQFARAWQSADLDALVALLTGDVFLAMPPEPFGYQGQDLVARYCARQFATGRSYSLVPARANGQPAFAAYLRGPDGTRHATAFWVLTLTGHQICGLTRFEASVLPWFGLPRTLPSR
jgi:RNA polymerase sigma-70 factor (ECF subfamily)